MLHGSYREVVITAYAMLAISMLLGISGGTLDAINESACSDCEHPLISEHAKFPNR